MLRNTLTFKFGKTIGLFYLICTAAGIFTITAEKIYYLIRHTQIPDYGLSFVVILLLNAFVIFVANFFAIEIILAVIDCFRIKKIINQSKSETNLPRQIYEYILFSISIIVPAGYICAILPNIK